MEENGLLSKSMNGQETIIKLRAGDENAFSDIYKRHWRQVYNFTRLYINSSAEVMEVVQEVFVKLWETRERLDETKNLEGLLFIMTRNLIFNRSRKSFSEEAFKIQALASMENSYNIDAEIEASDLKEHIDKIVSLMPPRRRQIFRMSREEHLSRKEIALQLGITEKAVDRSLALALDFIREHLPLFLIFIGL
jgi:RNA polymerase sigma-70 factor (ECF subfamily)